MDMAMDTEAMAREKLVTMDMAMDIMDMDTEVMDMATEAMAMADKQTKSFNFSVSLEFRCRTKFF